MRSLSLSLAVVFLCGGTTFAFADPVTITFQNVTTQTVLQGEYAVPPAGGYTDPAISTYEESSFDITDPGSTNWLLVPGSSGNHNEGNPNPGAVGGPQYGTAGTGSGATATIELTEDSGQPFYFDSFQLGAYTSDVSYTITGFDSAGNVLFNDSGTDTNLNTSSTPAWTTIDSADSDVLLSSVQITLTDGTAGTRYGLDNLAVTTTPEPASLMMLGTGLLGIGWVARRRLWA